MICRMRRKGNCYDHAVGERVLRRLQEEGFEAQAPDTRADATLSVLDSLVMGYHRQRLHSTLGEKSPNTFEARAAKTEQGEIPTQP